MNDKPSDPTNFSLPSPVHEDTQPVHPNEKDQTPAINQPANTSPPTVSGVSAHDVDLIEAEWVRKVEQVMRETINDPNTLSQRFSDLKEQYIGTRYGKMMKQKKKDS
jgi:hypothetical protein